MVSLYTTIVIKKKIPSDVLPYSATYVGFLVSVSVKFHCKYILIKLPLDFTSDAVPSPDPVSDHIEYITKELVI